MTAGARLRAAIAGLALGASLVASAVTAQAAGCRNTANFDRWLADFKAEARAQGISAHAISSALDGMTYAPEIVRKDRAQGVFSQSFLTFSDRMVAKYRMQHGAKRMKTYAKIFAALEREYGVPAPVITAFWGLETDFGANIGDLPVLRSLATLAYDCRRPELFRPQLMDALRLIDHGDLTARQMVGAWAGELGQLQFLPSDYMRLAVDYDGDGRRDLLRSEADVLASGARLIKDFGWHAGEPWLEEVRVPRSMPWEQADLSIRLPRSQWKSWGVTRADGSALPGDGTPVALLLPMGRNGPAFIAYRNFDIYLEWNQSFVYATTAAYFATRLAGAPPRSRGNAEVTALSAAETKQLQQLLVSKGYDVGGVDGTIGAMTRAAVRSVQQQLGLPADAYPTPDLLARLR
ncbi:lytic murein transglycosylase [Breoghania sp. L-A4]|uniref:lytic murein transglycosylase n=1 Tax=Breoghania sp. L-A4 TaxID=2304600 RepID=UPI000E35DF10|nr:lytic murein transglycosylase [Breoghania sp. L-A4]AXS41714.1 lytic murein transglycosylase [Breoghania sp. L-A4]